MQSETRTSRSNSDAPGRSVPVVRLTITSRGQFYPASASASGLRITSSPHVMLSSGGTKSKLNERSVIMPYRKSQ